MCGIFGWSLSTGGTALSHAKRKILFRALSAANDTRGGHSWGVYVEDDNRVYKGIGELADARFSSAEGKVPFRADQMFAHTRFKTHGEVSLENAHPFVFDHIVGAHNGIIYNHTDLNWLHDRKFAVDSMHIFAHIAEGLDLKDLEGYGAIEYHDTGYPRTTFVGQFGGDLAVAILKDDLGVIWSSEREHLKLALAIARVKPAQFIAPPKHKLFAAQSGKWCPTDIALPITWAPSLFTSWRDFDAKDAVAPKDPLDVLVLPCEWCSEEEAIRETKDHDLVCQDCYDYWLDRTDYEERGTTYAG